MFNLNFMKPPVSFRTLPIILKTCLTLNLSGLREAPEDGSRTILRNVMNVKYTKTMEGLI
jgi:hypothetical protein